MVITTTPIDMIERCLWSNYKTFVLKEKRDAILREIVEKNEPVVISEEDAYVIGLLNYVKTENLIHRCKMELENVLNIKSTIIKVEEEELVVINKSTLLKDVIEFKDRFPHYYIPGEVYKEGIEDLMTFNNELVDKINNLEEYNLIIKEKNFTFVLSSALKKLIKL